jgi:hypothetical protein
LTTADIIGAAGVFILLLAYFLAAFKKISNDKPLYFILNAAGAGIACYASWMIDYLPFVVLEGAWAVVSLIGLFRRRATSENG